MKLYEVGHHGPEHNFVLSIHKTEKGAFKAWDNLRIKLLKDAKKYLKIAKDKYGKEIYKEIVKNLSCKDSKKIDNYPQETPYIAEYELQE